MQAAKSVAAQPMEPPPISEVSTRATETQKDESTTENSIPQSQDTRAKNQEESQDTDKEESPLLPLPKASSLPLHLFSPNHKGKQQKPIHNNQCRRNQKPKKRWQIQKTSRKYKRCYLGNRQGQHKSVSALKNQFLKKMKLLMPQPKTSQ